MFKSMGNDRYKGAKQYLSAGLRYLEEAQSYIDLIPRNVRTNRGIRLLQKQHDHLLAFALGLESIMY